MKLLHAVIAVGFAAAVPAAAQAQSGTNNNQATTTPGQSSSAQANTASQGSIAHKLQQDLQQSGFKNVRVMPESFLVRADDKDGHPVMMIVNPDSVTAVTAMSSPSGSSSSGSSSNALGSSGSTSHGSNPNATTHK
jgi:hypothetical protein